MSNAPTFVEHALDLLSLLGPVQARSMFGGHGLYARGVMFGLLDDDELFVRTDDESRPRFLAAGCRMWVYPGMKQTSYYRPPDEAHEDPEAMLPWARLGLEAAMRLREARDAIARARAERRAEREAAAGRARRPAGGPPARKAAARKEPAARKAPARKPSPRRKATARGPAARKPTRPARGKG
jgi:DNA transformation protein